MAESPYSTFIRLLFQAVEAANAVQQQGIPAKLGFAPPGQQYQVQDADDPNYVYVRFQAGQGPARGWERALSMGRVNPIDNLPVRVQLVGKEYQVLGPDGIEAAIFDGGVGVGVGVGPHYHDFGPLFEFVSEHRLKPGLLTPYAPDGKTYTTKCFVEAFVYVLDGVRHYVDRQPTADLTSHWPSLTGKRLVAVGYDTGAQQLVYADGSVVGNTITLGPADLAALTLTGTGVVIPLDGVVLKYGTTQIDKSTAFVRHGRPLLAGLIYDPATAQFNASQLQGRDVAETAPTDGQALTWNGDDGIWEPGDVAGGSGGHEIQDNGTPLMQRTGLDFVPGAGIAWLLADDSVNDATEVSAELDIAGLTEDAAPVGATSYVPVLTAGGLKKTALTDLPAGSTTDAAALHTNVAGEMAGLTEKETPVAADLLIIEDSEDSNTKKLIQVGSLGGGGTTTNLLRINLAGTTTTEGCSRTGDSSSSYSQAFTEISIAKPILLHQVIADIAAGGTYGITICVGPRGSTINATPDGIQLIHFGSVTVAGLTPGQVFTPPSDFLILPGVYCIGLVRESGTSPMAVSSGEASYSYSFHNNRGIATSASRIPFRLVAYPGAFELVTG
ncbi:MAG TPA: hypothetical protein PKD09_10565 [Aggregatilinea sp.]|uniref:hypothetical protein n=1 Tax=Aggregatilinea sp. TaxID=2806333 RepID=UPI002C0F3112|nr:hypothetical protein [Aggregatilinea sp.]HML22085.1 hypothetical protein [Aggregatilinea sp.]